MTKYLILIFLSLSLNANPAFASDSVEDFISEAHESLEGAEASPKNLREFATHWKENFNFKKMILAAVRWSNVQLQDEKFRDHALNLALILPASHTLEMISGPALFYAANEAGASAAVQSAIAVSGALITIPGLDPLCLVLLASYKFEPVQKTFTAARVGVYRVSQYISDKAHLKELAQKILKKESRLDLILQNQAIHLVEIEKFEDQEITKISYAPQNEELLEVRINSTNPQAPYIDQIQFKNQITKDELKSIKLWMNHFGYNVRSALLDLLSGQEMAGFHIADLEVGENQTHVYFKPYSLTLRPRIRLKTQCERWLRRKS